ncbi:MAG: methyltransferase domain-containing protein, partial [Rhodospirillaceae bacterium]|nr:methyltransferase domain-containing protein [Rhodospirillaceae bacterium]
KLLDICGTASGIDPVWRGKESEFGTDLEPELRDRVKVVGDFVENVDFDAALGGKPDLVVSSFVFEHIREPRLVLERLFEVCDDDAMFVIQVPGTDMLLDNCRFDQFSHQHYQQFTLDSFIRMIEGAGGEYLGHDVLYAVWGAIMVAFRKGPGKRCELDLRRATKELVSERKERFDQQIKGCLDAVHAAGARKIYGLGAAQNFPSLAYYMGDVDFLEYIIDDDPARQNKYYPGFPVRTSPAEEDVDYGKAAILITAPDYGRVLIGRANQLGAEQCILPVNII